MYSLVLFSVIYIAFIGKGDMGKFIEEKALGHKFHHGHKSHGHQHHDYKFHHGLQHHDHHHHRQQQGINHYCSLEEKVSEFFNNDFAESDVVNCLNDVNATADGYGSDGNESNDSIQDTLYWESQDALLQEILERYKIIGSKLRQEIIGIIEEAKETEFCSCFNQNQSIDIGCINCLRQRVIKLLCRRGLSATLCVSKWKHTKNYPAGTHEYIEVIASTQGRKKQIPFVIELEFRDQFEIAKACDEYAKMVDKLPACYVGKIDYLNPIVGVMCDAAKRSMEKKKLHMGPWRKRSFMQMKWSNSSDRRSLMDQSCSKYSNPAAAVGFIPKPKVDTTC